MLIIEYECARLVQESSGTPAIIGNYILILLFTLGLILCIANLRLGYIIGMVVGVINVIVKIVIVFTGHEHFPLYPIVWITQSLLVVYFCYKGLLKHRLSTKK